MESRVDPGAAKLAERSQQESLQPLPGKAVQLRGPSLAEPDGSLVSPPQRLERRAIPFHLEPWVLAGGEVLWRFWTKDARPLQPDGEQPGNVLALPRLQRELPPQPPLVARLQSLVQLRLQLQVLPSVSLFPGAFLRL